MTKLLKLFCNRNRCLQQQSQEFLFEDEDCEFIIMVPTTAPQISKKLSLSNIKIRSLALFISFNRDAIRELNDDQFHIFGFHPISRDFSNLQDSSKKLKFATKFVQYCALNCWANGWKIVVIVSSHLRFCNEITKFIYEIRKVCDNLTLDIVIIQPKNNENNANEDREINNYIKQFHANASPTALVCDSSEGLNVLFNHHRNLMIDRNASDEIRFYNKKEPYYEFTNFFYAPIQIDSKEWKTSENYFQAQKFENKALQDKIHLALSARDAFNIARKNDRLKRKDWESPKQPTNKIFKEIVMKKAIFEKFSQHENLLYKLLSTSNALLFEHTDNDFYWGDGGKKGNGLNRLGIILQEVRKELMLQEMHKLEGFQKTKGKKWMIKRLKVLSKFE